MVATLKQRQIAPRFGDRGSYGAGYSTFFRLSYNSLNYAQFSNQTMLCGSETTDAEKFADHVNGFKKEMGNHSR